MSAWHVTVNFAPLLSANGGLVRRAEAWVLLIAFLLAAQPLGFTRHYALTPLNIVQSLYSARQC
jgi:hypothetical protein